jgi:hypothetical protein
MKVNKKNKFIRIKDSITIHLGKNPKKGGRPPKENNKTNNLIFVNWLELNILNV